MPEILDDDRYKRSVKGAPKLVSRMGTGKLGAVNEGAVGAGSTSTMMILSQELSILIAREMGCTSEQALRFLKCFGKVAQNMLLSGRPVGLPHLGLLALMQMRKRRFMRRTLAAALMHGKGRSRTGVPELMRKGDTYEDVNEVRFIAPRSMHRFFADNSTYTGHWRLHFINACKNYRHVTNAKRNLRYYMGDADHCAYRPDSGPQPYVDYTPLIRPVFPADDDGTPGKPLTTIPKRGP